MNGHFHIGSHDEVKKCQPYQLTKICSHPCFPNTDVNDIDDVDHRLPLLGTDIDRCDEETLDIEDFPNRPDLLSAETLSLAMRRFLHNQVTLKTNR